MSRLRVVRRQGDVAEIRYRKGDDGRYYKHETEGPTDLLLVEVDGKRGTLALPRGNSNGWEQDGSTYWLTNKPRRSRRSAPMATRSKRRHAHAAAKKSARRGTARRAAGRSKRRPPAGFATWSAYMASIRPTAKRRAARSTASQGDSTMAKRRRRKSRSTARRHSTSAAPRRRSRRSYARNPQFGGSGIVGRVTQLAKEGVIGGATVVAGEAATRLVRGRVLGMAAGETMSSVAEVGIAVAGGLVVERMFGRQAGRDFVVGGMAGVFRATAKQLAGVTQSPTASLVAQALSDDGPRIILPRNRRAIAGYGRPAVAGYLPVRQLAGETEEELGY